MNIRKINGKLQPFDGEKLKKSILEASKAANEEIDKETLEAMVSSIENNISDDISSEQISEIVENKLMASRYKNTARAYIRYRYNIEVQRVNNSKLLKEFRKKLDGENIENQNANLDENSFSGRMNEASRILLKEDALTNRMSRMAKNNHKNNEIYIHDLDSYSVGMHNCLSIPFDVLFRDGFVTKQTGIRPPRSVSTAMQLIAVLMQLQSLNQFGGVSATHLDWSLIPYVRYSFAKHYKIGLRYFDNFSDDKINKFFEAFNDIEKISIADERYTKNKKAYKYALDMTEKETHQGAEALIHNLNSLQSRSGGQLPFSSINYGTCTLPEGRMVIDAILDTTMEGVGDKHNTPIFPCGIFQYMHGVNDKQGTPNYDMFQKAILATSKRIYPNYCLADWSVNQAAIRQDREIKNRVISLLDIDVYNKLYSWIEKNKDMAEKINLYIENEKILVSNTPQPTEINSTMGKCKLQLI